LQIFKPIGGLHWPLLQEVMVGKLLHQSDVFDDAG